MLDDVLQLPNVARVVVLHQYGHDLIREADDILALEAVELRDEVAQQERDILAPFAKGGKVKVDDVQAVVEVLPEFPPDDLLLQVLVARGDEAHIHADGFGVPHPHELKRQQPFRFLYSF